MRYADVLPPSDGGSNATVPGWSAPCPRVDGRPRCRVDFSAMCWLFGRNLFEMLGRKRPIGLIASYVGGRPDEAWSSPDAKAQCVAPGTGEGEGEGEGDAPKLWSYLWNSQIAPLTNTTIKGAIWYQGEADSPRPGGQFGGQREECGVVFWQILLRFAGGKKKACSGRGNGFSGLGAP